jgi:uncharacterized membrane protein YdjX (TVP38/TMEM64 family)
LSSPSPASSPPRHPSPRRGGFPPLPWRKIIPIVAVLALAGGLLAHFGDAAAIHREAERLNGGVFFAALVVLPLFGFPASLLHVAAGIRFGAPLGLGLVAISILLQLLASYGIVHLFRRRFDRMRWLRQVRERLPEGTHASISTLAVLLPGAPFAAVNYTLPLIGVPLRTYLLCCLPLHVLRSTITVFFGDQSDRLSASRLLVLVVYALLILGASTWTYRRLRARLEDQPPEADGPKQLA